MLVPPGGRLERLTALAQAGRGDAAPLVPGDEDPGRLAFPIRLAACPARGMPMDDAGEERADG